jgi:hypothetical protein
MLDANDIAREKGVEALRRMIDAPGCGMEATPASLHGRQSSPTKRLRCALQSNVQNVCAT